ncbi:DNA-binding protein [Boudabousia tangfeifanii]|uniref:DNA-binding protein n=1 Tax=Boudabousia tangfeifanii TaxID=1912795 RepID=A0A1D9MMF3_9ACTO|nr:APC family permease [Boudabousia tangfeifanii]AOZ73472.1 DNA-binding protein [Boudabousia tangfeifanii]
MHELLTSVKRVLVGRPRRSTALAKTLMPKRIAFPTFAADALSSVAYAPDEILLTLALAGASATMVSPWIGLMVAIVLAVVILSYRQTVHAYPSGGGDYQVVTKNLGRKPGLIVASALLIDYVLTVAVSISSGAAYLTTVFPSLDAYRTEIAILVVLLMVLAHLRGVRESGTGFAIPTYLYLFSLASLAAVGLWKEMDGTLGVADSAKYEVIATSDFTTGLTGILGAFLVMRAFTSGCVMVTGVEAVSNGVPSFERPKSKNAATTLALLGLISTGMLLAVLHLARITQVRFVSDPATQLLLHGQPVPEGTVLDPVIGQLAGVVFDGHPLAVFLISAAAGLILLLAANTAFTSFPVLASVLSRDSFLPRQLYKRGDRLSYSNGILALGGGAIVLIVAFNAQVTSLVQMYIVGVFISITMSQLGMIRHWNRELNEVIDARSRQKYLRARLINQIGLVLTALVLVVVLFTKFAHGAWLALLLMALLYLMMLGIYKHYTRTSNELKVTNLSAARVLPTRIHAVVLVSSLNKPAMRAIAYARAATPTSSELLSVLMEPQDLPALKAQWEEAALPMPLTFIDSPYRDITGPVLQYIRTWRRRNPRDLVVVYIPEYLVEHWWQNILHNQTALRLKTRLLFTPGVVVCAVPWRLGHESRKTSLVRIVNNDQDTAGKKEQA